MAKSDDLMKTLLDTIEETHRETKRDLLEVRKDISHVKQDISDINVTTARQQASLEEHMRRTEANEKQLDFLHEKHEADMTECVKNLEPLKAHVAMWGGAGKVLVILGGMLTAVYTALKLLEVFGF